jgi:hypothetical protein
MKRHHRFLGLTPEFIGEVCGKAQLLAYLTWRQTSPDGAVYYGQPLPWSRVTREIARMCELARRPQNTPLERTLRRTAAALEGEGLIRVRQVRGGNVFHRTTSRKWAAQLWLPGFSNLVEFGQGADAGRVSADKAGAVSVAGRRGSGGLTCLPYDQDTQQVTHGSAQLSGSSSTVERRNHLSSVGNPDPQMAGSTPAPRSNLIRRGRASRAERTLENLQQKELRLKREVATILDLYAGSLELPEGKEAEIRELLRELGSTQEAIREYELGLGMAQSRTA